MLFSCFSKGVVSGLMLLDLDHFKRINDNFGHHAGDQILSQLVPLLKQMIRQQDSVFRYGGEEFVLLIKEIQLADLHRLAEKSGMQSGTSSLYQMVQP